MVTSAHVAVAGQSSTAQDGVTKFSDLLQDSTGKYRKISITAPTPHRDEDSRAQHTPLQGVSKNPIVPVC